MTKKFKGYKTGLLPVGTLFVPADEIVVNSDPKRIEVIMGYTVMNNPFIPKLNKEIEEVETRPKKKPKRRKKKQQLSPPGFHPFKI